jgi:mono/diheme cytochrome c family protein
MLLLDNLSKKLAKKLQKKIKIVAVLLITGLIFLFPASLGAIAAENGQVLFEQTCAGCHTLDGTGKGFAPDLQGITEKRDRTWLNRWILAPDQMIEEKDPIAVEILAKYNNVPMPNMGLNQEQVTAIVDYLASGNQSSMNNIKQEVKPVETVNITDSKSDNITLAKGAELFIGKKGFEKQTPACISCHSAGIGSLNGGTLGPNLTHVFGRYGEIGLSSVLQTLPYPTMQGIYQNKPLNPEEQKALLAFFQQQDKAAESSTKILEVTPTITLILIGIGGCLLLLAISNFIWRDRFTGVRNKLIDKATQS